MTISVQCEYEKNTAALYAEMSNLIPAGVHRIRVMSDTISIYMSDNNFSGQKIIVNQIKQFMRDNSYNYTMEMK